MLRESRNNEAAVLCDLMICLQTVEAAFDLTDGTNGAAMVLVTRALQSKPLNQA